MSTLRSLEDYWGSSLQERVIAADAPPELPTINIPEKCTFLLTDQARFKVLHGGRGGAKSRSIAICLVIRAVLARELILCTREYQTSIGDSVHRLIKNTIIDLGLDDWFVVQEKSIRCPYTGSEFIFKGLHHSISEIKSTEGITICWVEEAQAVSKDSWTVLVPTIRGAEGAEIWVSFNPYLRNDPTSQMFIESPDQRMIVRQINWSDNPWFPSTMEADRLAMLATDPEAYEHVYNGHYLAISNATIFRGNYEIVAFDTPHAARFHQGIDFGFAESPTHAIRCYVDRDVIHPEGSTSTDRCLYIDYEAYGHQTEIDDLPALLEGGYSRKTGAFFPGIPDVRKWPIKGDAARPETISYLRRRGFNIAPADKWKGSVEDGIAHIKGFRKVYIHIRCPRIAEQARLYSFKVDEKTDEILPVIVKKHDHGWDACRYSLDGYIQRRGADSLWRRIAQNAAQGHTTEPW